uniref:GAG-pre-integrase domain-containing protein n=1 Tax=Chenopodium quinoa TaxID=63459 RepID=A0A803M9W8_CHEQI
MAASLLPPTQDPTSPYFIHPSENTSQSLISEKFSGEGYGEWKRSMIIALSAKNKLCFIDGSLPQPAITDSVHSAWKRCDAIIISYILRSLDTSIARSVLYLTTSREIWKDLEEQYSQTSGPQFFTLQQKLTDLHQGDETSIADFFTQIKAIWDQISEMSPLPTCNCSGCTCGLTQKFLKQQQEERLVQMLMKLNNKYNNTRSNILMMQPLPPISLAYRLLIQEEKQQELSVNDNTKVMAFAADSRKYPQYYKPQYQSSANYQNRKANPVFCEYCKIPGHTVDKCFKKHGYPPNFGNNSKFKGKKVVAVAQNADIDDDVSTESDAQVTMSMDHYTSIMKALQSQDIGASSAGGSLAPEPSAGAFVAVFDKFPNTITIADGKKVIVEHIGTVNFENGIQLRNVLHVPGFKFNLISTYKLCKDLNCEITFTHDKCLIQDPTMNHSLVLGSLSSGLYSIDDSDPLKQQKTVLSVPSSSSLVNNEAAKLWHLRLGHLPFNNVDFSSPYEKLYNTKPRLDHLRVFGSLCYISTLKNDRTKFDSRASPCVMMGYPPDQKAYRVLNLENNKIIISRDVVFYEKYLPFHYDSTLNQSKIPIFLPTETPYQLDISFDIPEPFILQPEPDLQPQPESHIPDPCTVPEPYHVPVTQPESHSNAETITVQSSNTNSPTLNTNPPTPNTNPISARQSTRPRK